MRQTHFAGEKMFVDYAGPTVSVTNPVAGAIHQAQIFVAVLGASSLFNVNYISRPGREEDPAQDFLLACLWDGFERELLRVFPGAREIITSHEPNYDSQSWAAFLSTRGFDILST